MVRQSLWRRPRRVQPQSPRLNSHMNYLYCNMKKKLHLALALAALATGTAQAQLIAEQGKKWDIKTGALIRAVQSQRATRATVTGIAATAGFVITTADAHATADSIRLFGGTATVITPTTVSATLPLNSIERVAAIPGIGRINAARQFRITTKTARALTGVDKVHSGTDLETPYTGRGVIVGVIDQGFQFRHPAFLDANQNPRTIYVWNHLTPNGAQGSSIPPTYDGNTAAGGHATHVTAIAAGTRYEGNPYYGMAPEADIIMIPSTFSEDGVLAEAKWIKQMAEADGKPWVINMSFGTQMGPHDGSTTYDQAMSDLCGAGGIMAGAMGNEGAQKIHVSATVKAGKDRIVLLSNSTDDGYNLVDFWGNATDGASHFEVTPIVYNGLTNKTIELTDRQWRNAGQLGGEIDAINKKEHYQAYVSIATMASEAGITNVKNAYFGLRVKATGDDATFHAWAEPGYGEFISKNATGMSGDTKYLVGQAAASIPRAIGVASFNGAGNWVAATDGKTYQYNDYATTGKLSSFSSPGPSLGTDVKPTVAAPGATITSALNRYVNPDGGTTFDKSNLSIVGAIDRKTGQFVSDYSTATSKSNDFYGVKSGTSMATPAVAGIIALWLQANPSLTPEDIVEIIKATAKHDAFTGTAENWTAKAGYGKIDAYAGLKAALEKGTASGIDPTMSNAHPVTLSKAADGWRILFNTTETRAEIKLTALDGTIVSNRILTGVRPGDETVVSTAGLRPGVYVVSIVTSQAAQSHKLIVGRQ